MDLNDKKYPRDIERKQGNILEISSYYHGLSVALKTSYGEVIVTAADYDTLEYQAMCLMPPEFEIDEGEIRNTAMFSLNKVTE